MPKQRHAQRGGEVVPEPYLQAVLDSTGDVLKIVDRDMRIQYISRNIEPLIGKCAEDCIGQKCHSVLHGQSVSPAYCLTPKTFETGQPQRGDGWMTLANGARRFVQYSTYPIKGPDGKVVSVVEMIRDATEKKLAEEQLIQNAKLVSLGEAAAGIAHEVRGPLNAIKLGLEALEPVAARNPEAREIADVIRRNVERLAVFMTDMLTFSRKDPVVRAPVDVRNVVQRAVALVEKQARQQDVEIVTSFPGDLEAVPINSNQIEQVVLNVLLNAIQAMPDGGRVEIAARPVPDRPGLLLSVTDTGAGIRDEDKRRVFEPFYSTKPSGTGLGLAISSKIVRDHGGSIAIRDSKPKGTVVEVFLPRG